MKRLGVKMSLSTLRALATNVESCKLKIQIKKEKL